MDIVYISKVKSQFQCVDSQNDIERKNVFKSREQPEVNLIKISCKYESIANKTLKVLPFLFFCKYNV